MMTLFTLSESLIILFVYCCVLDLRHSGIRAIFGLIGGFAVISAVGLFFTDAPIFIRSAVTVTAAFLCSLWIFRSKWYICLFSTLLVCYELIACDILTSNLLSIIFGSQMQVIVSEQSAFFALLGILSKLFALGIVYISIKFVRQVDFAAPRRYWLILNVITLLFYLINLFFISLDSFITEQTERMEVTFICATYIVITILVFYMFHELGRYYTKKAELIHTQIQNDFFKLQLSHQKQAQKEISILRHDIRNHLISVKYLTQIGNYKELEEYLNELLEQTKIPDITAYTGIDLLDAIITSKKQTAAEHNVIINIGTHPLKNPPMIDNYKLTGIFSNLFDNAINAAAAADDKNIDVKISQGGSNLSVQMINSYSSESGSVISDHPHLGLGLGIVNSLVKESGGCFDHVKKDGKFIVNIILPVDNLNQ